VIELVRGLDLPPEARLLDVGCGTGATAAALTEFGTVAGVDFSPLALERCGRRGLTNLMQGQAEALPLRDGCVDVIVATDILEHIEDDHAALREFHRVLKPGGHAVLSVPAYQMLWGEHDLALMHKRRYLAGQLGRLAARVGFRADRLTYALCFLLPVALARLLKRRTAPGRVPEAQIWNVPAPLNAALIRFQRMETALLRWVGLPWGLSVIAVLRKPDVSSPRIPAPNFRHVIRRSRTAAR
jgi:SAM-dependent methyltransferase